MAAPAPAPRTGAPVRVLVVDDSAVVRGLMIRWLQAEQGIEIAGVAIDGADGVRLAADLKPDVIILDVEMPNLDGLSAIPKILEAHPSARILMASTLTRRNAEITVKALSLGAADYLPKPETGRIVNANDFKRDLISRVRALGQRRASAPPRPTPAAAAPAPASAPLRSGPLKLRPLPKTPADIVVIASSTGGPQALNKVIAQIGQRLTQPILIVQHMPAMFTAILAEHLGKLTPLKVIEARDGMPLRGGVIHVAPGDFHMRVAKKHGAAVIALDQGPPINFCRPAADPLFKSAADEYGSSVLGIVLTGMGSDGRNGAEAIVARGGSILAQDEATSVVWGMPGAVAAAGLCAAIKPLDEIGHVAVAMAQGKQT